MPNVNVMAAWEVWFRLWHKSLTLWVWKPPRCPDEEVGTRRLKAETVPTMTSEFGQNVGFKEW